MQILNTEVYGLKQSLIRAGYPMSVEPVGVLQESTNDMTRGTKLGNTRAGSGHDCFLKGILVQADFDMPQYWWQQAKRYHWFDIVSSQSTMHRICKFNISTMCTEDTDPRAIEICKEYILKYQLGQCKLDAVLANIPSGLKLTVGISTNYLQLKTMYAQRQHHRLIGWNKVFRKWVQDLPYSEELGVI